ncbi:MAG: protein-glutamate O-methyltransferase [Phenylobacterium sp.]|uniref:protein-glutamate O-methyltransferase n=1 Tax=Phenylobacterium sp. TaxID=1871053 RepID=UPI001A397BEF|nr:protein-glutamate O-methyltransferase [Phenylobacterium sp.]MBL8774015.1 protein-glutamate O-methyltransferase [Phenylobacterium sp.]
MGAQAAHAASSAAGAAFVLEPKDFRFIADILHRDSGIRLGEGKSSLVYSRLSKRLRALGLTRFRDYCELIESPEGREERAALLSALTTNVTRFYREPHHFEALREQVVTTLAPAARAGARVRLWSAGCSNGHEPYSMAMTLLDALPEAGRLDVRILATDIDPVVVQRARLGQYDPAELQPVPPALRQRYSQDVDGQAVMADEVRALISFGTLNLHGAWPMKGDFDAIFCRNVAIYFDEAAQAQLWRRFAERLSPKGRLYIGHSERADVPGLTSAGLTIYRRAAS